MVVLPIGCEAEATQHAQPVRIERQQASLLRKDEDLVGAGLPDHGKLGQGATGLGGGKAKRCPEIAIPSSENQFGRVAEARGASPERDRPTEAGDRLQRGRWSGQDVCWLQADLGSKRNEGSTALDVRHEVAYLLPEDQVKGIPADRGRRLAVVAPESCDY
jgi:hypothetical protein